MSLSTFLILLALSVIMMIAIHYLGSDSLPVRIVSVIVLLLIVVFVATMPVWYAP